MSRQGVRTHHRRTAERGSFSFGQHIRIGERADIPSGYFTADIPSGILLRRHFTRMSHIRNLHRRHHIRIFHIRRLTPDGRGRRFNFSGQHIRILWQRLPEEFRKYFPQCSGVLLKLPDMCDRKLRYFEILCFRYLLSKSPNSPYNPPIIGFLSL